MPKFLGTLVFDVDGLICDQLVGEGVDYASLTPYPEALTVVNGLYDKGYEIVFETARFMGRANNNPQEAHKIGYELTLEQLTKWGFKFHTLKLGKSRGDLYVDDKGLGCPKQEDGKPDWDKIYQECLKVDNNKQ